MKDKFIEKLVEFAEKNDKVVLLTGDLGRNCLEPFIDKFPERYFNVGSCEQNMIGVAGGLAMQGFKVFVYSIANFASMRCFEHLRNIVNYHNLDVNIIAVGAGFEYGLLGYSHLAIEDVGVIKNLSNFEIYEPATLNELDRVCEEIFYKNNPKYIRLSKGYIENCIVAKVEPYLVSKGEKIALFCLGNTLNEVLLVKKLLKNENIDASVYSCPCVKRLNSVKLKKELMNYNQVFTIEEHFISGLGESLLAVVSQIVDPPKIYMIGVENLLFEAVGAKTFLQKEYKLDAQSIFDKIKTILKTKEK